MCEPPFATAGIYYPFFPSVSHASNYTSNYKIATPIRGGKAPNQAPGLRETWFCRSRRIIGEALSPKPILLSLSISLALSLFLCLSRSVFLTLSLPPSLSLSPSRGYIGYPCEATRRHPLHSIPPRPPPPPHVTSLILLPAEYPSEALRRPEVTFSDNLSLSLSLSLSQWRASLLLPELALRICARLRHILPKELRIAIHHTAPLDEGLRLLL